LKEEFGLRKKDIESSSAVPSAAQPRYPPAGSTLPQQPEREQEARPENYGYGNTGAGGFSQSNAGQWEGMNSPNTYGSQNPYVSPPLHPSSGFQNTAGSYGAPTISYSSLPRPGFPGARSAQPGIGGWHGASNQSPAPSGYQGQYQSPHSQHQAPGRPTTLSQFNPPLSSGQTMQPVYPGQYPSAGQHVASPTSPYQPGGAHESSWQNEHHNQYGGSNRLTGSLGGQYYSSTQTEQSAPPHSTQPYSAPLGNVSPSEVRIDPALASQVSYAETPSSPAQDEVPIIEPATLGDRRQPIYRSSHGARVDSSIIESESERQTSHEGEPDSEAPVEVPSFQVANQQRSQNTKSTSFYQL
jgi:hypothetical protein